MIASSAIRTMRSTGEDGESFNRSSSWTFAHGKYRFRVHFRHNSPMFDTLSSRFSRTLDALRGRGRITEENVGDALREVRVALLEADVALPVIKSFIDSVKSKALGAEVAQSLTPGQTFIGIRHRELV